MVGSVGADRWACLPTDVVWVQQGFRDASCTDPVLFESGNPRPEHYLLWGEPCSSSVGLKEHMPIKGTVYELYDGRCSPRSGVMIHEIPTPIEPSAMGEFERISMKSDLPTERSGGRLALFTDKLVGPDGSFEYKEPVVVDLDRDVEGGFYRGQDGKFHFLPASRWASESSGFVDSACTEALVNLGSLPSARCGASRPPSTNALQFVGDHADPQCRAVRVVGAPTKPVVPTVYLETGGSCSLMPYPGTETYTKDSFVELPASESPEATRSDVRSDALAIHGTKIEFRARKNSSPDGLEHTERKARAYLRDYGVSCEPKLAADGEYRCLPSVATAYDNRYHADEACTQKVLKFEYWTMPCEGDPTLYVVATRDAYAYPYVYEAYRWPASSPLNQTTYYWLDESGSCTPVPADPGSRYYAVTAADEPIPPTEFPAVTTEFVVDR